MTRILRQEAAKSDLKEIWKYIASDSTERANDFLRALNDKAALSGCDRILHDEFTDYPEQSLYMMENLD